jgi:anti-sigma28 factor (negative regulator of flagellin synthesis)
MSAFRPNFSTHHKVDVDFHITVTHADDLNDPRIDALSATLQQMRTQMAETFNELMNAIRTTGQEIKDHRTAADAAEVAEDEAAAARDAENARRIKELEDQIAGGTLSADEKATAVAALNQLRIDAGLDQPGV